MRNAFFGIIVVTLFLGVVGIAGNIECHYTIAAEVVEIENDTVVVVDTTGNEWAFSGEGYFIGQPLKLKMFDNHTTKIYDDEIEKVVDTL